MDNSPLSIPIDLRSNFPVLFAHRNIDGGLTPADVTTYERLSACSSRRRAMREKFEGERAKLLRR